MDYLPIELHIKIFSYLSPVKLEKIKLVNKLFYKIATSNDVWDKFIPKKLNVNINNNNRKTYYYQKKLLLLKKWYNLFLYSVGDPEDSEDYIQEIINDELCSINFNVYDGFCHPNKNVITYLNRDDITNRLIMKLIFSVVNLDGYVEEYLPRANKILIKYDFPYRLVRYKAGKYSWELVSSVIKIKNYKF